MKAIAFPCPATAISYPNAPLITRSPVSSRRAGPSSGWIQAPTPVRSLPVTSSERPSGIHCAPNRLWSSAWVMLRGDPPAAGAIHTSLSQVSSPFPSRGYQYATVRPSGEKTGLFSNRRAVVSGLMTPLATSSSCTCTESSLPLSGATTWANAIVRPSVDQLRPDGALDGGSTNSSDQEPLVSRRGAGPLVSASQICCGWSRLRRNRS